jgi:hypothetical protein
LLIINYQGENMGNLWVLLIFQFLIGSILAVTQFVIGVVLIISSIVKKRKTQDFKQHRKGGIIVLTVAILGLSPAMAFISFIHTDSYEYKYEKYKNEAEEKNLEWVDTTCTKSYRIRHFLYKGEEYVGIEYLASQDLGIDTRKFSREKLVANAYYEEGSCEFAEEFGKIYEIDCGYDIPMLLFDPEDGDKVYFVKTTDFDRAMNTLPKDQRWLKEHSPDEIEDWEYYSAETEHNCQMSNEK